VALATIQFFYFSPLNKSFAELSGTEKKSLQPSRKSIPAAAGGFAGHAVVWPAWPKQKKKANQQNEAIPGRL